MKMKILEKIIDAKKEEVAHQKKLVDIEVLKEIPDFIRECNSLKASLLKLAHQELLLNLNNDLLQKVTSIFPQKWKKLQKLTLKQVQQVYRF